MVSMFTIPFFWDSTHYEVYSILSHLLGGLPLPTCSLCVSNYTTLISAFLREGALPRVMWWWLGEAYSSPVLAVSSLLTWVSGPCFSGITWTSLLAHSVANTFELQDQKKGWRVLNFNDSVIILELFSVCIASPNLHSVAKCFRVLHNG